VNANIKAPHSITLLSCDMLRLRTSSSLSLLALVIGIAGTRWISTQTAEWRGASRRVTVDHHVAAHVRRAPRPMLRWHAPRGVVQTHRASLKGSARIIAAVQVAPVELRPLSTPVDTAMSWDELRGHLDGRVVVHIAIDDSGRVNTASLVESSGDPVLDEHALRSVRGWRFAVSGDRHDGLSGDLPMHFSTRGERIASVP
jgi:protein TonB